MYIDKKEDGKLCESPYVSNKSDVPYLGARFMSWDISVHTHMYFVEKSEHDMLW